MNKQKLREKIIEADFVDINDFEGLYKINHLGSVRSIFRGRNTGKMLKPNIVGDGYYQVQLSNSLPRNAVLSNFTKQKEPDVIAPQKLEGHFYWSNFLITSYIGDGCREHDGTISELQKRKGFNIGKYKNIDKRLVLRNCVEPEIGKHILNCALGLNKQKTLF